MIAQAEATKTIPLMMPYVTDLMRAAVAHTLETRWIGQGPAVEEFEQRFSERMLGRPCVATGSCTDALHLAYLLAGIGPGDEVIAPVFTCTATNIPLLYCGATIRFADVGKDSLNVDPEHVRALVTERTKAIVIVHYGGMPVDMIKLISATGPWELPIIEDCAQALGGFYRRSDHPALSYLPGAPLGYAANYACFSFQAVKHVTTGDGGMLVLKNEEQLEKARRMRWFGIDREAKLAGIWENDIREVGFKYQMTDIAASMGIMGLEALDEQIARRREMRDTYVRLLEGMEGIRVLDRDSESACWLCTVLVERREDLRRKLLEHRIESDQVHYRNDRYSIFRRFKGECLNMDAIEGKYLVLPMHMGMDCGDVERICEVVRSGW